MWSPIYSFAGSDVYCGRESTFLGVVGIIEWGATAATEWTIGFTHRLDWKTLCHDHIVYNTYIFIEIILHDIRTGDVGTCANNNDVCCLCLHKHKQPSLLTVKLLTVVNNLTVLVREHFRDWSCIRGHCGPTNNRGENDDDNLPDGAKRRRAVCQSHFTRDCW